MASSSTIDLDLDLASKVQRLLFPKSSPPCDWCCMGVKNHMALGLGGDFFDFFALPDGCQVVFLGDVTGHGLQASVVMSLLYGYLHRASTSGCLPKQVVAEANDFLQFFAKRSRKFDHYFSATLFYSIIDPASLMMIYVNAGHVAPLVKRGKQIFALQPTASPLGYFNDPDLEVETFQFEADDRLLLYTDGISDSFNARGQFFGSQRIEQLLLNHSDPNLEFLDRIFTALHDFGAADPPDDDCTAIVIDLNDRQSGEK
jgi:serine phosphatase RsbU (regulator of sigma subunit)